MSKSTSDRPTLPRRTLKALAWSISLLVFAGLGMAAYLSWLLSEHQRAVHKARELKPINCPEGTSENTRPWQKMGMIRYCEPDINGRVQIWTEGYLEAEGEFRNGKEHGRWIFDPTGKYKRKRIVVYDNGLQLSEERTEQ